MSDPYGSYGDQNPGEPQSSPSSYYGQGAQPSGNPEQPVGANPRPSRVTTASIIAIVMSSLAAVMFVLTFVVTLAVDTSDLEDVTGFEDVSADDLEMVINALAGVSALFVLLAIAAIVAAVFTLKGRRGGRMTLIVLSFIAAALCLLGMVNAAANPGGAVLVLIWGIGTVAVAVMLLSREARAWFDSRG